MVLKYVNWVLQRWLFPQHGGFPIPRLKMHLAKLQWSRVMSFEKVGDIRIPCSPLRFFKVGERWWFRPWRKEPLHQVGTGSYESNLLDDRTNSRLFAHFPKPTNHCWVQIFFPSHRPMSCGDLVLKPLLQDIQRSQDSKRVYVVYL